MKMMQSWSYTFRTHFLFIYETEQCLRFTGVVKLKSIVVIGGDSESHPNKMKAYDLFQGYVWCIKVLH